MGGVPVDRSFLLKARAASTTPEKETIAPTAPARGQNGSSRKCSCHAGSDWLKLPVLAIHSTFPHVLPTSQNCPKPSTTIHLNPEVEKHNRQVKREQPTTPSRTRTLFTKTLTVNQHFLPCPNAAVYCSPPRSTPDVTAPATTSPASAPPPIPASNPNQARTHEDARQLVQHPVLGCSHALQMLLGAAGLQDGTR